MGDGSFGPDMPIKRENMCVIISRAFKNLYNLPDLDSDKVDLILNKYHDKEDISDYAKYHVANVTDYMLMQGSELNKELYFALLKDAKRPEAATLIYRIYYSGYRNLG